jgi:hypothetical protein
MNMEVSVLTRRNAITAVTLTAPIALAACSSGTTPIDPKHLVDTVVGAIKAIQDGVAKACTEVGHIVPEADSVLALLRLLLGVPTLAQLDPIIVAASVVEEAIKTITAKACPSPAVAAAPREHPKELLVTPMGKTESVPIKIIQF